MWNFLIGIVMEIAEFHKRCGGHLINFRESIIYKDIVSNIYLPRSNCFNVIYGNINPMEAQVLASLVTYFKPQTIFEIGTYNGFSAIHMEKNISEGAVIYTLDLPLDRTHINLKNDLIEAHQDILTMDIKTKRYFHNVEGGNRIKELYGDSLTFDFSPYYQKVDFVFIDGNHSSFYVKSDSENAFKMLTERGVILWHDYDFIHPAVYKLVNELARTRTIFYIERTRFTLFVKKEQ